MGLYIDRLDKYEDIELEDIHEELIKLDGDLASKLGKVLCERDILHRSSCTSSTRENGDKSVTLCCWYCGSTFSYNLVGIREERKHEIRN